MTKMKTTVGLLFVAILHVEGSIWSLFNTSNATTVGPSNDSKISTEAPRNVATTKPTADSFMTKIMDQISTRIETVNEVVRKAVTVTLSLGQQAALQQLRNIQKQMGQVGESLRSLDIQNFTHVSEGLHYIGGKLFGISGNATEIRQQLLNAAIKSMKAGTLCKSPTQLTATVARAVIGNIFGDDSATINGTATGSNSLAGAGSITETLAKEAEGAGSLSAGFGVVLEAAKCFENLGPLIALIG